MRKPRFHAAAFPIGVALAIVVLGGCTGEDPIEIDLDATVPSTSSPVDPDDPNAAQRQEIQLLAEQQCLDDPELVVGTVRIVDPVTNEVVSELIVQCDDVRSQR